MGCGAAVGYNGVCKNSKSFFGGIKDFTNTFIFLFELGENSFELGENGFELRVRNTLYYGRNER